MISTTMLKPHYKMVSVRHCQIGVIRQVQTSSYFSSSTANVHKITDQEWTSSKKWQLLQESPVPTDKFQASLPRLPIPKLDLTLDRYLLSQRPLLNEDKFNETKRIVEEFRKNAGKALNNRLCQKDKTNKHTSYINKPWTDMYLKDRRSVAFNHNPGLKLVDDRRPEMQRQDFRVTNILIAMLRFFNSYRSQLLKPDVFHMAPAKTDNETFWNRVRFFPSPVATPLSYLFKVFPLDMHQHPYLFQSTRLPQPRKDVIKRFPESKHVLVLRKGHFYTFQVYDENGQIFSPSYYLQCIRQILNDNPVEKCSGIGVFTAEDRDRWTELRGHLESLGNRENLEMIDSALCAICLDDDWTYNPQKEPDTLINLVSGHDPTNRWFDKSFSLFCSTNGSIGINFEHAWGDGVAVMRLIDEMIQDSQTNDFVSHITHSSPVNVQRLEIITDGEIRTAVETAKESFHERNDSVSFHLLHFADLGRSDCKRWKISPDSLMQSAFQIAYYKLYSTFVPTYESCSTAVFKHGRTETLRPCTSETSALTKAMTSKDASKEEIFKLLQNASKKHSDLTKMAIQGQGWDRHLFGLRCLAEEEANKMPFIFADEAYDNINQNVISTSTLSTACIDKGSFCPVVSNGFGVGYQIRSKELGAIVSSFKANTNGQQMIEALEETFSQFRDLLQERQ